MNHITFTMDMMEAMAAFLVALTDKGAAYTIIGDGVSFEVTITGA